MKAVLVLALLVSGFAIAATGQGHPTTKPTPSADAISFGNRQIRVPAPDGFTAISGKFERVMQRMRAGQGPTTELLEAYVPLTLAAELRKSQDINVPFYTLVAVGDGDREKDFSQADYDAEVAIVKDNFNAIIDPNGPVMKAIEANADKNVSQLDGSEANAKFTGSKPLGFFEKSDKVFSGMMLSESEVRGRHLSMLMTVSMLYVNHREVLTYFFKMFPAGKDFTTLPDLAKKWNAAILAANK